MISVIIFYKLNYLALLLTTTNPSEVYLTWSSRTKVQSLKFSIFAVDRDRTVSRRSKPSSRTTLIGEQPNPWELLQPQDVMSRRRGAKLFRRYGLSETISLLSPAYLLFVERWLFHSKPPDHYDRPFLKRRISARSVNLTVKKVYAITLINNILFKLFFVHLRYFLGGDRPSQTTFHKLS